MALVVSALANFGHAVEFGQEFAIFVQYAERRFNAAGDLEAKLFAEEKRQRIFAAAERWPQLTASSIPVISEASPSYVSAVLNTISRSVTHIHDVD